MDASRYNRLRDLPRIFMLFSDELDDTIDAREKLVEKLLNLCCREAMRGMNNQWPYNPALHSSMITCYRFELAALRRMKSEQLLECA